MTGWQAAAFVSSLPLFARPGLVPQSTTSVGHRATTVPVRSPTPRPLPAARPLRRATPCALESTSPAPRASPFAALLGLSAVASALPALFAMALLHPLVLLRDRARRGVHAALARAWMRTAFGLAGVRVNVTGSEKLPARGTATLFVANCQSALDMFAVAAVRRPTRFVVPAAALRAPVVGWVMSLAKWVGVGGADRRAQMKALQDATAVLQDGACLCMFPEGAPSKDGRVGKFSPAPFRAAKKAGVSVVPITLHGTMDMFAGEGKAGVIPACRPKRPIQVMVHSPISSDDGTDKEIAELAYKAVSSGLPSDLR